MATAKEKADAKTTTYYAKKNIREGLQLVKPGEPIQLTADRANALGKLVSKRKPGTDD